MAINLMQYLDDMSFPSTKSELITHARERGADEKVLRSIQGLPREQFDSMDDLSEVAQDQTAM